MCAPTWLKFPLLLRRLALLIMYTLPCSTMSKKRSHCRLEGHRLMTGPRSGQAMWARHPSARACAPSHPPPRLHPLSVRHASQIQPPQARSRLQLTLQPAPSPLFLASAAPPQRGPTHPAAQSALPGPPAHSMPPPESRRPVHPTSRMKRSGPHHVHWSTWEHDER